MRRLTPSMGPGVRTRSLLSAGLWWPLDGSRTVPPLRGTLDCSQQPKGPWVGGHSIIPGGHFCCWLLSQAPNASIKVLPEDSQTETNDSAHSCLLPGLRLSVLCMGPSACSAGSQVLSPPIKGPPTGALLVQDHSVAHPQRYLGIFLIGIQISGTELP